MPRMMILATVAAAIGLIFLVSIATGVTRIAETLEHWRNDELRREAEESNAATVTRIGKP